jgi:diguanylate cyclase (GGDEF)-like protein
MAGRLYLIDPARNAVVEACDWRTVRHSHPEFPPTACWALRRGVPHRPLGAAVDVPCGHLVAEDEAPVDTLCLPLTAHGEMFGLLYFERLAGAAGASATAEIYLWMLAENVGLALANLRLRERLRTMAMGDALTGLANRRQLDASLDHILHEAERSQQPISCLMVDIDHFKGFNDRFGHAAGDLVLRHVGATLLAAVREKELAFRYGGEEFLLLLPGFDVLQAVARAEQIREQIDGLRLFHDSVGLDAVHSSVGVASWPRHGPIQRLVRSADAALLRAKAEGRNRVVVATDRESQNAA